MEKQYTAVQNGDEKNHLYNCRTEPVGNKLHFGKVEVLDAKKKWKTQGNLLKQCIQNLEEEQFLNQLVHQSTTIKF